MFAIVEKSKVAQAEHQHKFRGGKINKQILSLNGYLCVGLRGFSRILNDEKLSPRLIKARGNDSKVRIFDKFQPAAKNI